jgi:hypothetical protein
MGAMKAYAIDLEQRQEQAIDLGDPALAYRLGMYEACRLINAVGCRYLEQGNADPFYAITEAWNSVFDAAKYLGETGRD